MIIAVDFDGILCTDKFPNIGEPNYYMIGFIRQLIDEGHKVILWTSRVDERLIEAVEWCKDRGLHFTAVNHNDPDNLREFGTDPRKVYADIYIDDHSAHFVEQSVSMGYDRAIKNIAYKVRRIISWENQR